MVRLGLRLALALWVSVATLPAAAQQKHPLRLDDLFAKQSVNGVAVSPDGEWVAVSVIRPAGPGEVYGRTFYEMDTGRADMWLVSRRTGERRRLTRGADDASGYWCPSWSPDGRRLAMLSTRPQGAEPRGGDNVRLYVWDREGDGLTRLTSRGMMTMLLGGTSMYRVELWGHEPEGVEGASCGTARENAPFVWLDDDTLLAVTMADGEVSGRIDAFSRSLAHAGKTLRQVRGGEAPSVSAMESGGAMPEAPLAWLQRIEVAAARAVDIAGVPAYPLDGSLQIRLAPDGRRAALLATLGAIAPTGARFAQPYMAWGVEKRLGFVDLAPGAPVRWVEAMPEAGRYPLDLGAWSPDGRQVAVRARPDAGTRNLHLFAARDEDLSVSQLGPPDLSVTTLPVGWTTDGRALVRATPAVDASQGRYRRQAGTSGLEGKGRPDWWLLGGDAAPANVSAGMEHVPDALLPIGGGRYAGIADDALWALDVDRGQALRMTAEPLPKGARVLWPRTLDVPGASTQELVLGGPAEAAGNALLRLRLQGDTATPVRLPALAPGAEFRDYLPRHDLMLFADDTATGSRLWATDAAGRGRKDLVALNAHLADVQWGERRMIDYRGIDGEPLKAGVILPPGYRAGKRYPTVVWVYAGVMLSGSPDDPFMDAAGPGQYNLDVYAARGYVVLVPSMPLERMRGGNDDYIDLPKGVMPAVDRLIELGIADPDRLAVMGQSYGGYSVYSLVTYTKRFKAGIAMAGITDLVSLYGQFDTSARGYGAMEHQKSASWGLIEQGQISMGSPPWEDLWRYLRNSPLYYVQRVTTPLLLIHGEFDVRGPMDQAEEFFFSLYRQGKPARLLRYWGEDHGLRQSPANVRDMVEEIFAWLERHMPERQAESAARNGGRGGAR